MTPEQELELLRLKLRILELEKEKREELSSTESDIVELVDDEPVPLVSPSGVGSRFITREELDKMTPGELFVLAHRKGIKVERIFPI